MQLSPTTPFWVTRTRECCSMKAAKPARRLAPSEIRSAHLMISPQCRPRYPSWTASRSMSVNIAAAIALSWSAKYQ